MRNPDNLLARRKRPILGFAVGVLLCTFQPAFAVATGSVAVGYRSAENVYLDTGRAGGVNVGDRLQIMRDGRLVALVEVVFSAEGSASCSILEEHDKVIPGDLAEPLIPRSVAKPPRSRGREFRPAVSDDESRAGRPDEPTGSRTLMVRGLSSCLKLRTAPGNHGMLLDCLEPGTRVTEIEATPLWYRIQRDDGLVGWSAARYLQPDPGAATERSEPVEKATSRSATLTQEEVDARVRAMDRLVLRRVASERSNPTAGSERATEFLVRYRSLDSVFINGGRHEGLSGGDLLEVVRDGTRIASLRVSIVDEMAAGCRILSEESAIRIDDKVRRTMSAQPGIQSRNRRLSSGTDSLPGIAADSPPAPALNTTSVTPVRWQPPVRQEEGPRNQLSGSVTAEWEGFKDTSGPTAFDSQRADSRLSLRYRHIGGKPYDFRLRLRTQQDSRARFSSATSESTRNRNRFYELSLSYDPPQGRYSYRIGRMSSSPFTGIGYLDGVLGQMALTSSLEVGGFFGASADVETFEFEAQGQKYGLFTRFTSPKTDSALPWEIVLAGIREEGKLGISREYLTLQSRYVSSRRWSIFQRAEFDLNRGWRREVSGRSSQLSVFSLTSSANLTKTSRFTLSYDRFEQYRTEDTRLLPEDLFDIQRQGFRASVQFGPPRGLNFSLNAGLRDQKGESENTLSYGFSVRHSNVANWGLSTGFSFLGFSNSFSEGYVATLRTSKRLPGGHQLDLTVGDRSATNQTFENESQRETYWIRLGAWFELPRELFATAEYEIARGDDIQGSRLVVGVGRRF